MTTRLTSIALAAAFGLSSAAALAGSPEIAVNAPDTFRKFVSYSDLDLTSATGGSILKHRVRVAAQDGCHDLYRSQPLGQTMWERSACVSGSVRTAYRQIDNVLQMAALGKPSGTQIALVFRK